MLQKIKMIVMDVDGTLTDGKIYIGNNGEVLKAFSVKDGLRIKQLSNYGIIPVIITGRKTDIVNIRAKELGISEIYQGIEDKVSILKNVVKKYYLCKDNIAYIGDDENDLPCFEYCGHTACTQDASYLVKEKANYICEKNGGEGAVREYLDFILGGRVYECRCNEIIK